ncbi:MAG: AMP-binding protein [Rhabdochlamydiaceae bacterium]|nr:AMP-binding protein [Rhabdochlamydiaceae bacterium]
MRKNRLFQFIWVVVCGFVRFLISLRYRVEVAGLETLTPDRLKRPGGILFLPNHPAEIDPVIVMSVLGTAFSPRPLVVDRYYFQKGIHLFMKFVRALPMPSTEGAVTAWRAKKILKQFEAVAGELKNRENFLIYPSGRLKMNGLEMIGGASFVHDLLQACPDTNVVLVRTTGLWGSQFSRAIIGASPDFAKTLWKGFKILLKNGIFFAPRRRVLIELALAPQDFPYQADRLTLNKYLERWYNRYPKEGPEELSLVSLKFWKKEFPNAVISEHSPQTHPLELKFVPPLVEKDVQEEIARLTKRPKNQIRKQMHLAQDLGLDSLDVAQLYVFLSERFEAHHLQPGELQTVEDVMQAASGRERDSAEISSENEHPFAWPKEKQRPDPDLSLGNTLQEAFLLICDRMGAHAACVDALSGMLTYRKMKLAVILLREQMLKLPGKQIGVMLPASSGTYLVILAILCAGKVPVMINWTSGSKALDYAAHLSGIEAVISSDRFLDRLENGELGAVEPKLVLMEDLRKKIGLKQKLCALVSSYRKSSYFLKKWNLDRISPQDPAVILFTSGTESLPKGVPLSHNNLLSNQRAALACVHLPSDEIFYGVLPPFHSFGFSVTGLLPLLAGIKVCYAPDPTDSRGMAHQIARWKPTLFCCAPSFFRALFHVAKPEQLQSLRYVVAGAEKTPDEIFSYVSQHIPHAQCLEGYGITECGPIVTLTRPDSPRVGVGAPLPGVEIVIVDGNGNPVPTGEEGEVCIRGPNVFKEYLGKPREAFVTIGNQKWYASSDRGKLDGAGNLILSGRLKRFVKIGGEMVGLSGLEEELLRLATEKKWIKQSLEGPPLAVSAREVDGEKTTIILYTVFPISLEDANRALKESGFGRLVKISEVKLVAEIPLTGTGKTHYRLLDETSA